MISDNSLFCFPFRVWGPPAADSSGSGFSGGVDSADHCDNRYCNAQEVGRSVTAVTNMHVFFFLQ